MFFFLLTFLFFSSQERFVRQYNLAIENIKRGDYKKSLKQLMRLRKEFRKTGFESEINYRLAECYFKLGEYKRALKEFENLAKEGNFYLRPEAIYGLVLSSIMLGDFKKAENELKILSEFKAYQNDPRILFAWGILYYLRRENTIAIEKLAELNLPEARYLLAKIFSKERKTLSAINIFRDIISKYPNTPLTTYAHFAWGLALYLAGDYQGAEIKFDFFRREFPDNPLIDFAHYFLASSKIALDEYASAIEYLKPLTRHNLNNLAANATYLLGICYLNLKDYEKALHFLRKAQGNFPKSKVSIYASLQIPLLFLAKNDTLNAILTATHLTKLSPHFQFGQNSDYFLGILHYQMADYQKAMEYFEKVSLEVEREEIAEMGCLMVLFLGLLTNNYSRAIAIGERYLKERKKPPSEEIYYLLAENYYYAQRFPEAEMYYEQVKQEKGQLGKAYCAFHTKRFQTAQALFENLYKERPNDTVFTINALLGLGYTLFNQQEYFKALNYFDAVIEYFPQFKEAAAKANFYAGYCCEQLKYYGEALKYFKKVVDEFPNFSKADEAAFRIGDIYFKAHKYQEAIAVLKFLLERFEKSVYASAAQALIAQSYYNMKDYKNAILEYQKFLDLFPNDIQVDGVRKSLEMAYYQAALWDKTLKEEFVQKFSFSELAGKLIIEEAKNLMASGEHHKAILDLNKVATTFIDTDLGGDAQLLIAECYSNLKDWENTKRAYERFLKYFPRHPNRDVGYFNLGVAHFNLEEYKEAKEKFQTVIGSFPNSEYKDVAQKNLEAAFKKLDE